MEDGYCIETVCIKRKTGTTIALVLWLVAQSVVYFVHQEKWIHSKSYTIRNSATSCYGQRKNQ